MAAKVLSPQMASDMAQHFNQIHKLDPSAFNQHHLRHTRLLFPEEAAGAPSVRVVNLPKPLFAKGAELRDVVGSRAGRRAPPRLTPSALPPAGCEGRPAACMWLCCLKPAVPACLPWVQVDNITRLVLREAREHAVSRGRFQRAPPLVVVNLQWPMLGLALRELPLAAEVMRRMTFSPQLWELAVQIAQRIPAVAGMAAPQEQQQQPEQGSPHQALAGAFNGLHLRLEKDASEWQHIIGGYNRCACCSGLEQPAVWNTR